jgi:hypothetical protein
VAIGKIQFWFYFAKRPKNLFPCNIKGLLKSPRESQPRPWFQTSSLPATHPARRRPPTQLTAGHQLSSQHSAFHRARRPRPPTDIAAPSPIFVAAVHWLDDRPPAKTPPLLGARPCGGRSTQRRCSPNMEDMSRAVALPTTGPSGCAPPAPAHYQAGVTEEHRRLGGHRR